MEGSSEVLGTSDLVPQKMVICELCYNDVGLFWKKQNNTVPTCQLSITDGGFLQ